MARPAKRPKLKSRKKYGGLVVGEGVMEMHQDAKRVEKGGVSKPVPS